MKNAPMLLTGQVHRSRGTDAEMTPISKVFDGLMDVPEESICFRSSRRGNDCADPLRQRMSLPETQTINQIGFGSRRQLTFIDLVREPP